MCEVPVRSRFPHVFVLLTWVILGFSLLSWVIPSGQYERERVTVEGGLTRNVVVADSFTAVDKHYSVKGVFLPDAAEGMASPVSALGFLSAIPRGLEAAADIIFFLFVLGAVFGVLQRTGAITASIGQLTKSFGEYGPMLVAAVMFLIGLGGSTLGMGEEFIPLVPVFLLMARQLKFDRLFGLAVVLLGSTVGFAAATTNPFTVSIAQGIAEVRVHSGMGMRVVFFMCAMSLTVVHLLRYGWKVQQDPEASLVADVPESQHRDIPIPDLTRRHVLVLAASAVVFGLVLYGVQAWGWWMAQMGGGFLLMGLLAAFFGGLDTNTALGAAIEGMRDMVVAAMVVGVARAIVVVMEDALILDTIVHLAALVLKDLPPLVGAVGMFVFQSILNLFVPSGSGQAAVTMPLMAPLADLIGITRQTAVFAFQCGDGLSNMIIPTSPTLMAMLLMADVPYERWIRFCWPLFLQLSGLAALFLGFAVLGGYA